MSKRKNNNQKASSRSKDVPPPRIEWKLETVDILKREWWRPIIIVANVAIPLEPRPAKQFKRHERDAVMTWITMSISEILFGHPKYLSNDKGQMQKNPDWIQLPFVSETESGEWVDFQLESMSLSQEQATADNNGPIIL